MFEISERLLKFVETLADFALAILACEIAAKVDVDINVEIRIVLTIEV